MSDFGTGLSLAMEADKKIDNLRESAKWADMVRERIIQKKSVLISRFLEWEERAPDLWTADTRTGSYYLIQGNDCWCLEGPNEEYLGTHLSSFEKGKEMAEEHWFQILYKAAEASVRAEAKMEDLRRKAAEESVDYKHNEWE